MWPLLGGLLLYLPVRLLYLTVHSPLPENSLLTEAVKVVVGGLVMALALAAPRRRSIGKGPGAFMPRSVSCA